MALINYIVEKYGIDRQVTVVPVQCTSTSPFLVQVVGSGAAIPAKRIDGQTFSVGDRGMALWLPPSQPICFKVV